MARSSSSGIPPGCKGTPHAASHDYCYDTQKWFENVINAEAPIAAPFDELAPIEVVFKVPTWRSLEVMCGVAALFFVVCCAFAWRPRREAKYAAVAFDSECEEAAGDEAKPMARNV